MALEFNLKNIIAQATAEYLTIATRDPTISSTDDDTVHGMTLDRVLAAQEVERKELWDQLYAVSHIFIHTCQTFTNHQTSSRIDK